MIAFRDTTAERFGLDLRVHTNPEGVRQNINPFDYGSGVYTQIMKTDALKQALTDGKYDVAIGGARRDEERSRAKERVFSVRGPGHSWDPKRQRPELWHLYNGISRAGRNAARVSAVELDRTRCVDLHPGTKASTSCRCISPPIAPRWMRDGMIIVVDDERMQFQPGETAGRCGMVRFRSLGCYPLSARRSTRMPRPLTEIVREMRPRAFQSVPGG